MPDNLTVKQAREAERRLRDLRQFALDAKERRTLNGFGDHEGIVRMSPDDVLWLLERAECRAEAVHPDTVRYHELLYAVGNKYPNETRHQTALRYIRQAEQGSPDTAISAHQTREGEK